MSGTLPRAVDRKLVREALNYIRGAGGLEPKAHERMVKLLEMLQAIAQDKETEAARHFAGVAPRYRREEFESLARKLDEVSEQLRILSAPQRRYKNDKNIPPTRPTGLDAFREAMTNNLTEALSAEFVGSFGIEPKMLPPEYPSYGPKSTRNLAFAINFQAEKIVPDLLKRIAAGLRDAQVMIAESTPLGGPRENLLRETLLVNLVALWHELNNIESPCTYGGGDTKLFHFCVVLSRSLGIGNLCTEANLIRAGKKFNEKAFPETLPPDDPSSKDFEGP